jgi:hypothetical protein
MTAIPKVKNSQTDIRIDSTMLNFKLLDTINFIEVFVQIFYVI